MDPVLFLVIIGGFAALLIWFGRQLNANGVLTPHQKSALKRYDEDISVLEYDIKLLKTYGPVVVSLGDMELRETAVVLSDPTARKKNSPVQAILTAPKVRVEVERLDDLSVIQHDPKQRSTATRMAVGGALGGVPGAVVGGMAKKTTVPGTVELRNNGSVYVAVFSGTVPERVLEATIPIAAHDKALKFRSACMVRCESPREWEATSSRELKTLMSRRDKLKDERDSAESKWISPQRS